MGAKRRPPRRASAADKRAAAGGRAELLRAANLDIAFTEARGDRLTWVDGGGARREAIDFVGGFGSLLLGHNHPALTATAIAHLQAARPILTQGARRGAAEQTCAQLAGLIERETGRRYEVLLLNTGTEATEAALKHARLEFALRQKALTERVEAAVKRLRRSVEAGEVELDEAFYRDAEKRLKLAPLDSVDALAAALLLANAPLLSHPGRLVAIEGAFHGKTLGSLGLTWNPEARRPFVRGEALAVFLDAERSTLEELEADHRGRATELTFVDGQPRIVDTDFGLITAIFVEPIRGEGGVVEVEPSIVALIRAFRERYPEVPVVVDEIQCGLGRTGRLVEGVRAGLPLDYITFGKSLGGGLCKVSALAIDRRRFLPPFTLLHSSTFAEDGLSSAIAGRTLELIEAEAIPARVEAAGAALEAALRRVAAAWPGVIAAVRGRGLMLGVELASQRDNPSNVIRALDLEQRLTLIVSAFLLHEHGLRVLPTLGRRTTLRLQPSAYLDAAAIAQAEAGFHEACEAISKANAARLLRHLAAPADAPVERRPAEPLRDYSGQPPRFDAPGPTRSRVAFMGHFIVPEHIPFWDPSLGELSSAELGRLTERVRGTVEPQVYARRLLRSPTGAVTELSFIGLFLTSEQIEADLRGNRGKATRAEVRKALALARKLGCSAVGFGGYTSIATRNLLNLREDRPAMTTGNALTVGMGHEAIKRAAEEMGLALGNARAAVVGGTGNIGRVHARLLACEVAELTLIGRPGATPRLRSVAADVADELRHAALSGREGGPLLARFAATLERLDEVPEDREALLEAIEAAGGPLLATAESLAPLRDCELIVSASNSAAPLIRPEHLSEDPTLICDIAVPGDVAPEVAVARPRTRVILGGVVAMPAREDFSIPGIPLPPGQSYACMAETVIMGFTGAGKDSSRGPITTDQIRELLALARLHGVELAQAKTAKSF